MKKKNKIKKLAKMMISQKGNCKKKGSEMSV